MSVADLHVFQPVVLLGRRRRLLASRVQPSATRSSPRLVRKTTPSDADDVAEVQADQALEGLVLEDVLPGVELDSPGTIDEIQEGRLPVPGRAASRPATR